MSQSFEQVPPAGALHVFGMHFYCYTVRMALITLPLPSRYPWDFSAWLNTVIYCCRWVINAKESEIHRDSIFLFTLSVATGVLLHYLFIRLSPFQFTTNHFRIDENSDFRIYFLANYSFIGGDIGLNYSSTNAWRVLACASPYSVTMKTILSVKCDLRWVS